MATFNKILKTLCEGKSIENEFTKIANGIEKATTMADIEKLDLAIDKFDTTFTNDPGIHNHEVTAKYQDLHRRWKKKRAELK
jgi:hypothetical protein